MQKYYSPVKRADGAVLLDAYAADMRNLDQILACLAYEDAATFSDILLAATIARKSAEDAGATIAHTIRWCGYALLG